MHSGERRTLLIGGSLLAVGAALGADGGSSKSVNAPATIGKTLRETLIGAYSGPFYVDESKRIIEHEMFVSFFPNWRGQRQVRIVRLDDNELKLSPDKPYLFNGSLKAATITWRRARPNL